MANLLDGIEEFFLMGPGPSCVDDSVYQALNQKTIGHMDPYFIKIMDAVKNQLKILLNTQNQLTIPISGTGSAGMETCFVNLIEPGDPVLILINGVFGMRMQDVAGRIVSVDRVALAGIRAQCTCMAMGQAMGGAAALALKKGMVSRDVDTKDIVALTMEHGAVPI